MDETIPITMTTKETRTMSTATKNAGSDTHHKAASHHAAAAHHHLEAARHHDAGQHAEAKQHDDAAQEHGKHAHAAATTAHEHSKK